MTTEILPCPFCGKTPTRVRQYGWRHAPVSEPMWAVDHTCCPGHGNSEDAAIANWNRRNSVVAQATATTPSPEGLQEPALVLNNLRERYRKVMLKTPTTEARDTYKDGFFQALAWAIGIIDVQLSTLPQQAATGERSCTCHPDDRPETCQKRYAATDCQQAVTDKGELYLIRKGGAYYRPKAQGYTNHIEAAGRFTLEEAISYSHPNGPDGPRDGITYELAPPLSLIHI